MALCPTGLSKSVISPSYFTLLLAVTVPELQGEIKFMNISLDRRITHENSESWWPYCAVQLIYLTVFICNRSVFDLNSSEQSGL